MWKPSTIKPVIQLEKKAAQFASSNAVQLTPTLVMVLLSIGQSISQFYANHLVPYLLTQQANADSFVKLAWEFRSDLQPLKSACVRSGDGPKKRFTSDLSL
jgi:hypothetical protein